MEQEKEICVYAYVRVSTFMQSDNNSARMQELAIKIWCQQKNYKLVELEKDIAMSGTFKFTKRPVLYNLLKKLNVNDIIVTHTISRLSRNYEDFITMIDYIKEKGANFYALKEKLDTCTQEGFNEICNFIKVAEIEVKQTSDAAKDSAEYLRKTGRHNGTPVYGWKKKNSTKGSGLIEVPEEQEIIKLIRSKRLILDDKGNPMSFYKICNYLNDMKIPTPGGGKQWSITSAKAIHDRIYVNTKGRDDV